MRVGRLVAAVTVFCLLVTGQVMAATDSGGGGGERKVRIIVDGLERNISPSPVIINGRTLVPFRAFGNVLGADIAWDDDEGVAILGKSIEAGKPPVFVRVWPFGSDPAKIEVSQSHVNLDYYRASVAPVVIGDRVFLPFRLVTDALNYRVEWDESAYAVRVYTNQPAEPIDASEALDTLYTNHTGRLTLTMPERGWTISPSSVRLLRELTLSGNTLLDSYNRNTLNLEVDTEGGRVRFTDMDGAHVGDKYATHIIVWRNKYQATVLISRMKEEEVRGDALAAGGAALLSVFSLGGSTAWQVSTKVGAALVAGWSLSDNLRKMDHSVVETCLDRAEAYNEDSPVIGVVYTPFGLKGCLDRYYNQPLTLKQALAPVY